jgi:hypothetical protein
MNIDIRDSLDAPTASEISAVEKSLGIKINEVFLTFITHYNGGVPEPNVFRVNHRNDSSIAKFIDLKYIPQYVFPIRSEVGKYIIPIAIDSCGNGICISNERNDGEVYFWDHELPEGEALTKLAPSLADFLDMVHPDTNQITL